MKLFFSGDVVLRDETCHKDLVSSELEEIIREHDIVCCNLEGPFVNERAKRSKKRGPNIHQGKQTLKRLKKSGFNTLILANNHIMDYGEEGLQCTLDAIGEDFYYVGAGREEDAVYNFLKINLEGKTIGIIAIAECSFGSSMEGTSGCAWMGHEKVKGMFKAAKQQCDRFFVVCHCGAEELDVPFPEVRKIYKWFIDCGASAVIGHHPHVIQGYENYMDGKIFYSLGNFSFDLFEDSYMAYQPEGLCVSIEIDDKKIDFKPIFTKYDKGIVSINYQYKKWDKLNSFIYDEENYNKKIDLYCINYFEKYFKHYYSLVLGLDTEDEGRMKKFLEYRMMGEPLKWDYLFLYHNIAIETNRWICERAIRKLGYLNDASVKNDLLG